MEKEAIEQLFTLFFEKAIWQSIAIGALTYISLKLMTNCFNMVLNYILVKFDSIGIGTPVEYKGKPAVINNIGFTKIILETDDQIIFIRIQDWRKIDLVMQKQIENKSKTD